PITSRLCRSITVARYNHSLAGGQVGDITDQPLPGRSGGEVAADQVRRRHRGLVGLGQRPAPPASHPDDPTVTHDPLDPLTVDPPSPTPQLDSHPRATVGTSMLTMNLADLRREVVLGGGPLGAGRLAGQPL